MIQLNLLPDVKLEYIKAQRTQRTMLSTSVLVAGVAVVILVLLLVVDFGQKIKISSLSKQIKTESSQLQGKHDINKILTVQNQLESLTALHQGKPAADRLFNSYLDQVTPGNVAVTTFHVDFTQQTVSITGTADSLATVNKYIDTLKFTTYTTDSNSHAAKAFTNVVLSSFGLNSGAQVTSAAQAASYTITLSYDKNIFDNTQKVTLAVPSLTTTRSQLAHPSDLFQQAPTPKTVPGGAQ